MLPKRELVDVRFPGRDPFLTEALDSVHAARKDDAVPVHRGGLRKLVRDVDADAIALDRLDRRPGGLAVVAPRIDNHPGCHLVPARFDREVEDLYPLLHFPGQRGAVGRNDGRVRHVPREGRLRVVLHGLGRGTGGGARHSWNRQEAQKNERNQLHGVSP